MRDIFKKYPDFVIVGLAVLFLVIVAVYFFLAIQAVIVNLDRAVVFNLQGNNINTGFDLKGAQALDLRGLVQ